MLASESRRDWSLTLAVVGSTVLGAVLITIVLGLYLVRQYRELQLHSAAESGGLYVEGFLAPHAHEFFASGSLSDESKAKLEQLLERLPVAGRFDILKIWDKNGHMIFSTDGSVEDEDESAQDLKKALAGEIVVEVYTDSEEHPDAPISPPYLEIHAPIHDTLNRDIIAVGEVYQDATEFFRHRVIVERSIWLVLAISSAFGLSGVLVLIAAQRRAHLRHFAAASAIATQNHDLKVAADQARIEASRANEHLLNQIGAELHDGPIQMLSLMMLTLGKDGAEDQVPSGMTARELGNQVMTQLRAISTGLVLPEIRGLSLEATLRLAARRHEEFTGEKVEISTTDLPENVDPGLKICCYRLVQEGLMNAHRHAGGIGLRVSAAVSGNILSIVVSDDGTEGGRGTAEAEGQGGGIGLQGVRQRLAVFQGSLDIRRRESGGTDLTARIPLA
jgi:signal transduction histidine kinase